MSAPPNPAAPAFLRIHPDDDVIIALRPLVAGEVLQVDGRPLRVVSALPLGAKVAVQALPEGSPVRKWGESIGRTRCPIAAGDHVHVHNLESEFLATFERGHGTH